MREDLNLSIINTEIFSKTDFDNKKMHTPYFKVCAVFLFILNCVFFVIEFKFFLIAAFA